MIVDSGFVCYSGRLFVLNLSGKICAAYQVSSIVDIKCFNPRGISSNIAVYAHMRF